MFSLPNRKSLLMPRWESLLTRVMLAWLLWQAIPLFTPDYTSQPKPVALAQFLDFTWINQPEVFANWQLVSKAGLVLFALGLLAPFGLIAFLIFDISLHTFTASQGFQGHGAQLNALLALALLAGMVAHAVRQRGNWRSLFVASSASDQTAISASRVMLAATYVVAGLCKVYYGGWDWALRGDFFSLQIAKAQDEMVFTHAIPPLAPAAVSVGHFLVDHPGLTSAFLVGALLMELGGFVACLGRVPALVVGIGLLLFHKCNAWLMGLPFEGNQWAVIFLFIHPFYWLSRLIGVLPFTRGWEWLRSAPASVMAEVNGRSRDPFRRLLLHPALVAVVLGSFLLWRKEWYPFTHFPMYALLPPAANCILATDLDDNPLPLEVLGTEAPTLKKMINAEFRDLKKDGTVRLLSDLTIENWRSVAADIVHQMQQVPNSRMQAHPGFKLKRKDYEAKDGRVISKIEDLGTFRPSTPASS